jgi:hypothetical protein
VTRDAHGSAGTKSVYQSRRQQQDVSAHARRITPDHQDDPAKTLERELRAKKKAKYVKWLEYFAVKQVRSTKAGKPNSVQAVSNENDMPFLYLWTFSS